MKFENFAFILLVISTLTGLMTQALKTMLGESGRAVRKPNTLAGVVAVVLSAVGGSGYIIFTGVAWTVQTVLTLLALAVLSWLCAMLGYDKVMQTLAQLKGA